MTGMDVLRRVRSYEKDMEKLKLRRLCAHDAMTRCTRSADMTGHGGNEDKMSLYASRVDAIERAMEARRQMYDMEMEEAFSLIDALSEPAQGAAMYRGWICGLTVRQTAAELKTSESGVRGLRRRGRDILDSIDTRLDENRRYKGLEEVYFKVKYAH